MTETQRQATAVSDRPVVLYDGVCGFCNHAVQFLLRIDQRAELRFAALQSEFAEDVVDRHPELATMDTVVLVEHAGLPTERVSVRSAAALRTLEIVGGPWRSARVLAIVPRPVRDAVYDGFAKIRYRVFGKLDACPVPTPEVRARFLDVRGSTTAPR